MMTDEFKKDELVWAKVKYFPPWPAKVVEPPVGKKRKNHYYVYFLGSNDFGWIERNNISSFIYNYDENVRRSYKNTQYTKGVKKGGEIYHRMRNLNSDDAEAMIDEDTEDDEDEPVRPKKSYRKGRKRPKNKKRKKSVRVSEDDVSSTRASDDNVSSSRASEDNVSSARALEDNASSTISSSSSCIISIHYRDYRKIIPKEAKVLLKRCDEKLPSLESHADEAPVSESPPEDPPVLSPEC
ncbi:cytokine-like nuclear factor N-PAC [Argiope bruennichi]|uniref:Putative oxidoreductase GLYR1 like protein n=1 Tax=Argiope bruennichi TaxID=94029 RepID=A0A8T0FHH9_ARGBR|nr:cytokine-like nuclear factor N-PAC [Argiope bruennichi]KAF8790451.1 putative oxidoreductase GLYR1 like protein [Argiope bruennichi]